MMFLCSFYRRFNTEPHRFLWSPNSAFVAITRAKRWIFVSYPLQRVMPWGSSKSQTISRFVTMLQK
ncbi:hypothetical protein C5470_22045 [Photorhabdus stackebrandtii]|uniref:UvrD-like helicase C-terminal domain-containing protein n=1 Tax=Photorhabdus stackebrandtii TaxID=1123042 RepID=A0A7X5TM83_9GAMM|nr:hypothetical protein [Photorhabdus stackebrandtii]